MASGKSLDEFTTNIRSKENINDDYEIGGDNHSNGGLSDLDQDDDDDDGENVISLSKIKKSLTVGDDDAKSHSDIASEFHATEAKNVLPEINLQAPFQPGSSPIHLLSRFMVWNDTGIVKCYNSDKEDDSSIEVEFHDSSVHHSIHINNYLRHTMAALSSQALALSCPANDGNPSKLVVVVLQGNFSENFLRKNQII